MSDSPRTLPDFLTANMMLAFSGSRVAVELTVPGSSVGLREVLPAFRTLADAIVATAEADEVEAGRAVSCRKGCGACCRQLVPVAEVEARQLRDLVEGLPEPRRSAVLERFADAARRVDAAGLAETLLNPRKMTTAEANALGLEYLALGIACPFLEDESCSIYEDRPIICREYLVTSPPENCARPSAETIDCVSLPAAVSASLHRIDSAEEGRPSRKVPLSLALGWAADHPDDLPPRPGPAWISGLIEDLTGHAVPAPPSTSL